MTEAYYQPTADQRALAASFADSLVPLLPVRRLHHCSGETAAIWTALEQLGLFEIAIPEAESGVGLGAVEEALVVACLGRHLASPAVLATLGSVHAVGRKQRLRTGAAFRRNGITAIEDVGIEALLLRAADTATLHAVEGPPRRIDGQWMATLGDAGDLGPAIASFDGPALLRLRLIDAAALAGLAQAALEQAVEYAKLREQFGRAIGSFQAVKHHCANMAIAARRANDLMTFAAVAVDRGRDDAAVLVESAFVAAANASLENAGTNIQVHGGIGFSDEAEPHLFLKRAQLQIAIGGGVEAALERLGALDVAKPGERVGGHTEERT